MGSPDKLAIVLSSRALLTSALPDYLPLAVKTPYGDSQIFLPPSPSRHSTQSPPPIILLERNTCGSFAADAYALKTQGVTKAIIIDEVGGDDSGNEVDERKVMLLAPVRLVGVGAGDHAGEREVTIDETLRSLVVDTLLLACASISVVVDRLGEHLVYRCRKKSKRSSRGNVAAIADDVDNVSETSSALTGNVQVEEAVQYQKHDIKCAVLCVTGTTRRRTTALETVIGALVSKFASELNAGFSSTVIPPNSTSSLPETDPRNLAQEPKRTVVDTLISAKYILPMYPDSKSVLKNHAVVVDGDVILAILPVSVAKTKYAPRHRVNRPRHVLLPGFINTHTHTGLTLLRGCADDQPLLAWLHNTIWPVENAFIKEEGFCYDGALLSAAEMIRGGITTFADMYWFSEHACRAVADCGIRALIGMILIGFPSPYAATEDEYLNRGHDIFERYSSHSNLHFSYAPHAPYTVSDTYLERVGELAKEKSIPIHTHLHETIEECHASETLMTDSPCCHKSSHKMRPLANFHRMGLLDQHLLAAHMVHLSEEEIGLLASKKEFVHISHCPSSNAKLASGFAPVAKLLSHGVNVALGTDSAASNNSLDILSEMRYAALTAKNVARDPTVVPAEVALEMATVNGGKALGLKIGALREGWKADLVCMEVGTHERNSPYFDLCSALVYSSSREDVRDVWIGGRRVLKDGKHATIDAEDIAKKAAKWAERISSHIRDLRATGH